MVTFEQLRARRRDGPARDADHEPLKLDRPFARGRAAHRRVERMLSEALGALSEERRAALVMRIDHGMGYGDIAEAMGWPLQKVKNEIHRARLQLRERLATCLEGAA